MLLTGILLLLCIYIFRRFSDLCHSVSVVRGLSLPRDPMLLTGRYLQQHIASAFGTYFISTYDSSLLEWRKHLNLLQLSADNLYLGWFSFLTLNGPNQLLYSIFEPTSFLTLRTMSFSPTSNFFVHVSWADGAIRDGLSYFPIAFSNSLANSVLGVMNSSMGGPTVKLFWFRRKFRKKIFYELLVVFGILWISRQGNRPSLDPCCWPKLSGLLTSTFQPPFLPSHFLFDYKLKLSSNKSMHWRHSL